MILDSLVNLKQHDTVDKNFREFTENDVKIPDSNGTANS